MWALRVLCMQASRPPYVYEAHQESIMDGLFVQAKQYLLKLTPSHFGDPKCEICKLECAGKDSCCHAQQEQG